MSEAGVYLIVLGPDRGTERNFGEYTIFDKYLI